MGLDMYLERFPRVEGCSASDIYRVSEYFNWLEDEKAKGYTLKAWCGVSEDKLPPPEVIAKLRPLFQTQQYYWDKGNEYPHKDVYEEVGYWRKANEIHNWFVSHVQDGVDDCDYHHEVTKELLEELRDTCLQIVNETKLVHGKVVSGYRFENGKEVPIEHDGMIVEDDTLCRRLLPTTAGFFFGSTDYNEYYIEALKHTIKICDEVLEETDFETQMIYYCSSW